jgi:hypothetical protein
VDIVVENWRQVLIKTLMNSDMRKNFSKQAFRDLRVALKTIAGRPELSPVQRFNESLALINAFLQALREKVVSAAFEDELEEIYFFKFEKPEYSALKIFEVALFALNGQRPKGLTGMVRRFYLEQPGVIKNALTGLVRYGNIHDQPSCDPYRGSQITIL